MRRTMIALALAAGLATGLRASENCQYTGQTSTSGQARYCQYSCPYSGSVIITIPSYQVCPAYIAR